ncbi:hypothetical protein ACDL65_05670 [Corynebacterium belfantii]|uniref:hypothetical protein n=1 Tax=Corynebacterium belfantii TaxID=2014537 RepID=UPI00353125EC
MHVNCPQKFRAGSDFDGDVNAKVGKYLQRDCEFPADQISRLSIRDEEFGETTEAGTGDDRQSEPLLEVNDVKAGDKKITGSVFLFPGQKDTVRLVLPSVRVLTEDVELKGNSGEGGDTSKGKRVLFVFNLPDDVSLMEGERLLFSLESSNAGKNKNIEVYVKPAGNGNGQAPGGGAGEKPRKPHAPGGGADGNPRTGGGSLSSGSS